MGKDLKRINLNYKLVFAFKAAFKNLRLERMLAESEFAFFKLQILFLFFTILKHSAFYT